MNKTKLNSALLGTLIVLSCLSCEVRAQDLFANAYGGGGYEWAYSIQQTTDGGYVISGPTSSFGAGGYDYWIMKLDASGVVSWQKTYGGSSDDIPNSMQQTTDGGYILAGRSQSFGAGGFDAWVIKLDSSGNRVWQRALGGTGNEYAYSVRQTPDGGYIVAGATDSYGAGNLDYWVVKLDSSGNSVWQKAYGGSALDMAYASCLTSDGGVVVAGGSVSFGAGGYDVWIIKLDSSGNRVWQKAYGGASDDLAFSIQRTADDGYIVAGRTDSYGAGSTDFWILKLNSSGDLVWQKTYGGSSVDWAFAIRQTSDGGYIAAGRTDSFGAGSADAWILKLDSSGNVEWQRTYGGSALDYAYCVWQAADGSFMVGGVTGSFGAGAYDAMVLKLESSCVLGSPCPFLSLTSIIPGSPSPTATTTSRNPVATASPSSTTIPSSSTPTASRAVQCSYPNLPDAGSVALTVSKTGGDPLLSWQAPGGPCALTGYGIYRGTFPIFPYNHASLDCAVTGLSYQDSSAGDNQYYLVVPHNAYVEGSYGTSYDGSTFTERPPASSPCRPQCLLPCPGPRDTAMAGGFDSP